MGSKLTAEEALAFPSSTRTGHQRRRPSKTCILLTAVLLFVLGWKTLSTLPSRQASTSEKHFYDDESLAWEWCGSIDDRQLECGNIKVPLNQFEENDSSIVNEDGFEIPVIRLRAHNATKNLLLNPGGPGGSGVDFLRTRGEELHKIVGQNFHLVSFDPRGIGSSKPAFTCYPDSWSRASKSEASGRAGDSLELYAWTSNYVKACEDTSGVHGAYVNTQQTAADMNSILDALGQEKLVYWGFSYGSLLGQTYATLFPDRSDRVIIDGVVNMFDWYQGMLDVEAFTDSDTVLSEFLRLCWEAGDNCPLALGASSLEEYQTGFHAIREIFQANPLDIYINSTSYGVITDHDFWHGSLFRALYKPMKWKEFAQQLGSLVNLGNGTDLFLNSGLSKAADEAKKISYTRDGGYAVQANDGLTGLRHFEPGSEALRKLLEPVYKTSSFPPGLGEWYHVQQQWRINKTSTFVPQYNVTTARPLLILSTTYDPICPLKSARVAKDAFVDSRLVEVQGHGHCSLAAPSRCANEIIRRFLADGILPKEDVQCAIDVSYFDNDDEPTGNDKLSVISIEEREAFDAQVALARNMEW